MIDPLLLRIIALGFSLLFLLAAAHKLNDRVQFRANFEAYEILSPKLSTLVVALLPVLELIVGIGWLVSGLFGISIELVAFLSIDLLAAYTLAIVVNLWRGRTHIDCGCGFSSSESSSSLKSAQQISTGLVFRNLLLISMAIACAFPPGERAMHAVDFIALVFALISLVLIYGAFNQLLVNMNAINSWRHSNA